MGNKKSHEILQEASAPAPSLPPLERAQDTFIACESRDWGPCSKLSTDDDFPSLAATAFGTGATGKSCLLARWACNVFNTAYDPTIETSCRTLMRLGESSFCLDILDTAGQMEFEAMQQSWIREAQVFLLVFSLVDRDSFVYVKQLQKTIGRVKAGRPFSCVLCGTKQDLAYCNDFEPLLFAPGLDGDLLLRRTLGQDTDLVISYLWEPRHVQRLEVEAFAREMGIFSYVETSSQSGHNVEKLFCVLAHCILSTKQKAAERAELDRRRRTLRRAQSRKSDIVRGSSIRKGPGMVLLRSNSDRVIRL